MEVKQDSDPHVSVVICTRNRGKSVIPALESVFTNNSPRFEVILVDQSTNQDTADAVAVFRSNPHFRYIHSQTRGIAVSRNIGLKEARGEIVAYTDDDCIVQENWLKGICEIFDANPRVGMLFCNVEPAPYEYSDGYIPAYIIPKDRIVHSIQDLFRGIGLGAGMAFRRKIIISIGGFENYLSGGGEDHDVAIRIILNNWWIYESSVVSVTHFGFRSWLEGKAHTKRDALAGGAAYVKPIKCGYWKAGILLFSLPLLRGWWEPISNIFQGKKPQGFRRIIYFFQGVIQGLKMQVDCQFILYKLDEK